MAEVKLHSQHPQSPFIAHQLFPALVVRVGRKLYAAWRCFRIQLRFFGDELREKNKKHLAIIQ